MSDGVGATNSPQTCRRALSSRQTLRLCQWRGALWGQAQLALRALLLMVQAAVAEGSADIALGSDTGGMPSPHKL